MTDHNEQPRPVPPAEYIAAVAQHVASVCVITTEVEGRRFGLTATAVASVCAEPPRLLVCVNKSGRTHDRILDSRHFCVNVLAAEQERIAIVFAGMNRAEVDRFAVGHWSVLATGAPVLTGAAASFDCVLTDAIDQSTHSVLIGEVVATLHHDSQDALLYGGRRFRQLSKVFSGIDEDRDG